MADLEPPDSAPAKRSLVGFTAARSNDVFVIHIIDDADEVFEIEASREIVEMMVANLRALIVERQAAPPSDDEGTSLAQPEGEDGSGS